MDHSHFEFPFHYFSLNSYKRANNSLFLSVGKKKTPKNQCVHPPPILAEHWLREMLPTKSFCMPEPSLRSKFVVAVPRHAP